MVIGDPTVLTPDLTRFIQLVALVVQFIRTYLCAKNKARGAANFSN